MADINNPPTGGFQNGGWYWNPSAGKAQQYWNGSFGAPGAINNPNQIGYAGNASNNSSNSSNSSSSSSVVPSTYSGISDPVQTAQQLNAFQIQANQPAIQQLQSSIDPLTQRYNDLLTSIKGMGSVSQNFAEQSASMNLANRGLLPQSQEGQQALGNALLPVQQTTQSALSQTGLGEQQDINQINQAIASLQAGNPAQSAQLASTLLGQQLQNLTAEQVGSIANQFKEFGLGGGVVNTQTGELVGGGGGGGGGFSLSNVGNTNTTTPTNTASVFSPTPIGPPGNPNPGPSTDQVAQAAAILGVSPNVNNAFAQATGNGNYAAVPNNISFIPNYSGNNSNANSLYHF